MSEERGELSWESEPGSEGEGWRWWSEDGGDVRGEVDLCNRKKESALSSLDYKVFGRTHSTTCSRFVTPTGTVLA